MIRIRDLKVIQLPIAQLITNPRNPRTHPKRQIRQIARSMEAFGWTIPILVDNDNRVIAGHGRLLAAAMLKIDTVPVIRIGDMTDAQRRGYVLADNRLAESAEWNSELLALELGELLQADFDISVAGFEIAEIDLLLGHDDLDKADNLPSLDPEGTIVTQPGDLWHLGQHRLLCGDSRSDEAFDRLLAGNRAQLCFTDPPYNRKIADVSGLGKKRHAEFAMASGEMTEGEYVAFLQQGLGAMAAHCLDGAIAFVCIDWRHIVELLTAAKACFREVKNVCVWSKTSAGMGSLYRSQHEFIAVLKNGTAPHINNIELGRYGRDRSNVWQYGIANSFGADRAEMRDHPTPKPVALVRDAILDCSTPGAIVLDPFIGSGTTIIAAEMTMRRGFGIELEPRYVDVTLRRFWQLTGTEPTLSDTGLPYSSVLARRSDASAGAS